MNEILIIRIDQYIFVIFHQINIEVFYLLIFIYK